MLMKIAVLVKEVPDTYGERTLNLETGLAERGASEAVLDEISERALECALTLAATSADSQVVALTVGPESAATNIRKALALGADAAIHVSDGGMLGADLGLTAEVIAATLRGEGFDLVLAGNQSTDGTAGMIPAMVAELLGLPVLTNLAEVSVDDGHVAGKRATEESSVAVRAPLPAVVSVTEQMPAARFPNFKGIMAAKKKPVSSRSLSELGIDPEDMSVARTIMLNIAERPVRAAGTKVVDDGSAGQQLAAFLTDNRLI